MAVKKPAIPPTSHLPMELQRVLNPIRENLELLTGVRPGTPPIERVNPDTVTLPELAAKMNEVIARLNQRGT